MYTLAKSYIYSTHSSSCCCSLCVVAFTQIQIHFGGESKDKPFETTHTQGFRPEVAYITYCITLYRASG
jgi:hypothetical protein